MTDITSAVPNPGTTEAINAGCRCAIIDNGHGRGYMGGVKDKTTGETMFVYTVGCPVHAPSPAPTLRGEM